MTVDTSRFEKSTKGAELTIESRPDILKRRSECRPILCFVFIIIILREFRDEGYGEDKAFLAGDNRVNRVESITSLCLLCFLRLNSQKHSHSYHPQAANGQIRRGEKRIGK